MIGLRWLQQLWLYKLQIPHFILALKDLHNEDQPVASSDPELIIYNIRPLLPVHYFGKEIRRYFQSSKRILSHCKSMISLYDLFRLFAETKISLIKTDSFLVMKIFNGQVQNQIYFLSRFIR
jgi:hypothetical protein